MAPTAADATADALVALVEELTDAIAELDLVRERARAVLHRRAAGTGYADIVGSKERPFIAEMLTATMTGLGEAGGRYRRAQVRALRAEGCTVPEIARLFGVTRQRVSALLDDGTR